MAKSLRSKRKRKVRAEKRIVNAKKELVKLKKITAKLHGDKDGPITKEALESMIPHVTVQTNADAMQIDSDSQSTTPKVSKRQQQLINNQWMNQRKIKSIKSKIKKHNKKRTRRGGSAGLSSRKAKKGISK